MCYGQAHGSQPSITMATKEPLSSKKYIDGIYIPAGLLVVGVAIVKKEWLPYAVLVTLALSAIKFWRSREFWTLCYCLLPGTTPADNHPPQNPRRPSSLISSKSSSSRRRPSCPTTLPCMFAPSPIDLI